jgi:hypothetical protein
MDTVQKVNYCTKFVPVLHFVLKKLTFQISVTVHLMYVYELYGKVLWFPKGEILKRGSALYLYT